MRTCKYCDKVIKHNLPAQFCNHGCHGRWLKAKQDREDQNSGAFSAERQELAQGQYK